MTARLLLALVSTVASLVAVEAGLRTFGGVFNDEFTAPDDTRGWALRPGFAGWMSDENTIWVQINNDGMRDREHTLVPAPGALRIAVLGDSYMQGVNVPDDTTFAALLERELLACEDRLGRRPEVLNFGVSSYGTAQELLTFRHHAAKYQPDVVILAVYTDNDLFENVRELNPSPYAHHFPYFVLDGDQLTLDDSFREVLREMARPQPWWRQARMYLTSRFRVAQLLHDRWSDARPFFFPEAPASPAAADAPPDGAALEQELYREPRLTAVRQAWDLFERLLLALRDDTYAHSARLWVMTLANARQITPDLDARRAFAAAVGVEDLYYPDMRIRAFGQRHHIPVVTLAPAMADYAARHQVFLNGGYNRRVPFGEGHWNERGNRLAASLVADRLCREVR